MAISIAATYDFIIVSGLRFAFQHRSEASWRIVCAIYRRAFEEAPVADCDCQPKWRLRAVAREYANLTKPEAPHRIASLVGRVPLEL